MDEGISSEEIVDLLSKASQGLVHSENDNENNIPPLEPIEEEEESEDEIQNCIDESYQDISGEEGDAPSLVS